MEETTKLATISDFYGRQRVTADLNNYFGTDRFSFKYGIIKGCFDIYIKGKLEKAEIEKYQFFINGYMYGINIA